MMVLSLFYSNCLNIYILQKAFLTTTSVVEQRVWNIETLPYCIIEIKNRKWWNIEILLYCKYSCRTDSSGTMKPCPTATWVIEQRVVEH